MFREETGGYTSEDENCTKEEAKKREEMYSGKERENKAE